MGVEKDELTIQGAVAREAQILRDSTGTGTGSSFSSSAGSSYSRSTGSSYSRSTGSSYSRSTGSNSRSGRRSRHNNVRISVSGWVADRRHGRRRRTTDWSGS
jgi:hypothetical protein